MDCQNTSQEPTSIKTSAGSLWKTTEVAAYLNVAESCIRHWVHIGYIPHVKFRGAVRFREKDILEWLDRCAATPRTSPSEYSSRILRERR
jgi:excisionase family DNA binding protein